MTVYNPNNLPLPLPAPKAAKAPLEGRDAKGRWVPGFAPNPSGRAKSNGELRRLARAEAEGSVSTLKEIRDNPNEPAAARVTAAKELLDRGYGKATQPIEVGGPGAFDGLEDDELDAYVLTKALEIVQGG